MTTTEALRVQVKKYVDKADERSLRIVQTILEMEQNDDLWDALPDHVQVDVKEALVQSKNGEGITHEDVMKKYDKWRTK